MHLTSMDQACATGRTSALGLAMSEATERHLSIPVDWRFGLVGDAAASPSIGHSLSYGTRVITGETRQKRLNSGYQKDEPRSRLDPGSRALEPRAERPARRPSARIVGPLPEKGKGNVANVLPMDTRVRVISALVEGNSIRAAGRMAQVGKQAVGRLALTVGEGCARLHNRMVRDLAAHIVQMDEQWSFIQKKQARVTPEDPAEHGDCYSYIALDALSKLVISFHVGKRDEANTQAFVEDLRARLTVKPHVTSDGWRPYIDAVWSNFAGAVDYGMCVKNYRAGGQRGPDHRYEPPRNPFITKTPVIGAPSPELMSTSYVERFNLTMRHTVGRKRRLALSFSRKQANHRAAVALGIAAYNWVRVHAALGTTPAVAAGLAERPWTIAELVEAALAEPETEKPEAKPLRLEPRPGEAPTAARELPGGRGWLRLVKGGAEQPSATTAPARPVQEVAPPKPRPMQQLSLFGDDDGGGR